MILARSGRKGRPLEYRNRERRSFARAVKYGNQRYCRVAAVITTAPQRDTL